MNDLGEPPNHAPYYNVDPHTSLGYIEIAKIGLIAAKHDAIRNHHDLIDRITRNYEGLVEINTIEEFRRRLFLTDENALTKQQIIQYLIEDHDIAVHRGGRKHKKQRTRRGGRKHKKQRTRHRTRAH
jgi:hypothetical protein